MTTLRIPSVDMSELSCPLSGIPVELPKFMLPTNGDVIRHWRFLMYRKPQPGPKVSRAVMCERTASDVANIWQLASIPVIAPLSIKKRVDALIEKHAGIKNSMNRDSGKSKFDEKYSNFLDLQKKLFDVKYPLMTLKVKII